MKLEEKAAGGVFGMAAPIPVSGRKESVSWAPGPTSKVTGSLHEAWATALSQLRGPSAVMYRFGIMVVVTPKGDRATDAATSAWAVKAIPVLSIGPAEMPPG